MGKAAAKKGDQITATDNHQIQHPNGLVSIVPHPFAGQIDGNLSSDVNIMGMAAATKDSTATNTPSHVPIGGTFVKPPSNKGTIAEGSSTVFINGKAAARNGDGATTCNDPKDQQAGTIVATGTVLIG